MESVPVSTMRRAHGGRSRVRRTFLIAWLTRRGGGANDDVFPSRTDTSRPMTARPYARLPGD